MQLSHVLATRKRALAFGSLALAVVSLTTGASSLAIFTDQVNNTGNSFTTGRIELTVSPSSTFFEVTDMLPGDASMQAVTVTNSGTGQMRWGVDSVSTTGTGSLQDQLVASIGVMNSTACASWDGASPAPVATGTFATVNWLNQTLNAGSTTNLCFRVALPLATGNAFQNKTASTTFQFDAEQTAHNP